MKKTELYCLITLSFASGFIDFFTISAVEIIFPRDRILHIIISLLIALIAVFAFQYVDFSNTLLKMAVGVLILYRGAILFIKMIQYYQTFHGSNTVGIAVFSFLTAVLFYKFLSEKTHQLYTFFVSMNIILLIIVFILSIDNINAMHVYANSLSFDFSYHKLFVFFDIITIAVIAESKNDRKYAQVRYLLASAVVFIAITLLQGMCVGGNMLYSISPLQSLMQVFTGDTVKRYDYILTIYQTMNYFAAVMLYTWAIKSILSQKEGSCIEKA